MQTEDSKQRDESSSRELTETSPVSGLRLFLEGEASVALVCCDEAEPHRRFEWWNAPGKASRAAAKKLPWPSLRKTATG